MERQTWLFKMKTLLYILFSFFIMTFLDNLQAQKSKINPEELFYMLTDKAIPVISKLSKTESEELITQIRIEAKRHYQEIDNYYFLIHHLESMIAIEKEQSRLKSLNYVYALGLILFCGFLGYVFFQQRKAIESINRFIRD